MYSKIVQRNLFLRCAYYHMTIEYYFFQTIHQEHVVNGEIIRSAHDREYVDQLQSCNVKLLSHP